MIGLRYGAVVTVAEISSQMGEFKPMLPIGKETMIQRVVRTPVSYTHLDYNGNYFGWRIKGDCQ